MADIKFTPIDFEAHQALATIIRFDSFVTSFGYEVGLSKFLEEADDYLRWLQTTLASDPARAVHMKKDGAVIGQLEIGKQLDTDTGKLNLVYVLPGFRGNGFAEKLHAYAIDYFKLKGFRKAMLRCSPTNIRGFPFYKKMGWEDKGADSEHPEVHWMQLTLR